ncbi:hypothetical protein Hanom_Chr04g00311311 [Helianthus anomalus]
MVLWFTQILDLVPSFPKVHIWSLWFALRNTFSPKLFQKLHGWSLWFALCNALVPNLDMLKSLDLLAGD